MTIKNGDLPAMPNDTDSQTLSCMGLMPTVAAFYRHGAGLTKREQFAAMAMQGMLANGSGYDHDADILASYAVLNADALLAELERTK